jgi:hypothetical protein
MTARDAVGARNDFFSFSETFVVDPTGWMCENIIVEELRAAAETPGAFLLAWPRGPIHGEIMNDKALDRIHKLGPVVVAVLAALGLASAWGASQWQLTMLARAQDAIAADQRTMATDIRNIREGLAAMQVAARFNEERITELRGRVRDLERR